MPYVCVMPKASRRSRNTSNDSVFHREEYGDEMRQLNDGLEKFKVQCDDEVRGFVWIDAMV